MSGTGTKRSVLILLCVSVFLFLKVWAEQTRELCSKAVVLQGTGAASLGLLLLCQAKASKSRTLTQPWQPNCMVIVIITILLIRDCPSVLPSKQSIVPTAQLHCANMLLN